jgi:hypothetical protein
MCNEYFFQDNSVLKEGNNHIYTKDKALSRTMLIKTLQKRMEKRRKQPYFSKKAKIVQL